MYCSYPKKVAVKNLANNFDQVIEVIKAIRNSRAEFNVPDNRRTNIYISLEGESKVIKENLDEIAKLGYGLSCEIVTKEPAEKCTKIICGGVKIYLPMGQLVDSDKEKDRLEKEIEKLEFEVSRSEKMLSNAGFVAKAPASLVENEKTKLEKNKAQLEKMKGELAKL